MVKYKENVRVPVPVMVLFEDHTLYMILLEKPMVLHSTHACSSLSNKLVHHLQSQAAVWLLTCDVIQRVDKLEKIQCVDDTTYGFGFELWFVCFDLYLALKIR